VPPQDVVSKPELIAQAGRFIGKFPDLMDRFLEMIGERPRPHKMDYYEVDYSLAKRQGFSYRELPLVRIPAGRPGAGCDWASTSGTWLHGRL
jgi:histone deacetylase complex regulatory component SIN3